jgi:hypothetical protein
VESCGVLSRHAFCRVAVPVIGDKGIGEQPD